jgi:signal transduction histidine kinase
MKIADNGVGLYPGQRKIGNSFGLIGIEERVHALTGRFRIDSAPGKGTALIIHIPLAMQSDNAGYGVSVGR